MKIGKTYPLAIQAIKELKDAPKGAMILFQCEGTGNLGWIGGIEHVTSTFDGSAVQLGYAKIVPPGRVVPEEGYLMFAIFADVKGFSLLGIDEEEKEGA